MMYKGQCLHPGLLQVLAQTGHTDMLCVGDAGLPIPKGVERVDLAWKPGEAKWLDVCRLLRDEIVIEKIYLAEEMKEGNPKMRKEFLELFPEVPIEYIPHEELKCKTRDTKAVIRTGEFSSYCNCILVAGVNF